MGLEVPAHTLQCAFCASQVIMFRIANGEKLSLQTYVHMYCKHIIIYRKLLNVECTVTVIDRSHNKANNGIRDKSDSIQYLVITAVLVQSKAQSIQSARLSIQSSELGPPAPSPGSECCCPLPFRSNGGHTFACGRRGGGTQFHRRDWYSMCFIIPLRSKASTA